MNAKYKPSHCLIIGAMKAGTTSLFRYLRQHPEISGSLTKEPQFFSDAKKYSRGVLYYNRLWPLAYLTKQIRLEASTNYTKYPTFKEIPARIAAYKMNAKLLYIVRDPISRILSHYNHSILHGRECAIFDKHLVDVSKYHLQLSQFTPHFSRKDILIIGYESLSQDPEMTLNEITKFLNIKKYQFNLDRKHNVSDYSVSNKRSVTAEEQERLHNLLENDMKEFKKEYNFDTSIWGF